jgi:two-component system NarL family response regulator
MTGRRIRAHVLGILGIVEVADIVSGEGLRTPSEANPIRVMVVDDHALFRRGLEMVLALEQDIEVVGEAADGSEAVAMAVEMAPDIVLMDVRMPRRGGIDATSAIKEAVRTAKIVMLTISDEEADLYDAIKAGAMGYLLKEISIDEVASAIRAVYNGQSLISPSKLLTAFASMTKKADDRPQLPTPSLGWGGRRTVDRNARQRLYAVTVDRWVEASLAGALRRLPGQERARWAEEWSDHRSQQRGHLRMLWWAWCVRATASRTAGELGHARLPRPNR